MTMYFVTRCEQMASQTAVLNRGVITLPQQMRLERELVNQNAHSTIWLDGNPLSLDQVSAVAAGKVIGAQDDQKLAAGHCLAALKWILSNKTRTLTQTNLLRVHRLMTKGLLPPASCGRYRAAQNYAVNSRKAVIYTPPAPKHIDQRVRDLFAWLKSSKEDHPFVRSAVFHHELMTICPFVDGNGRVARAAAQWLLFEKGCDPLHTLGLEAFFAKNRDRYEDLIQHTRDIGGDYTAWIDFVIEGLSSAVQDLGARLKADRRLRGMKKCSLTPKQAELFTLLWDYGTMGSATICARMQINRARVHQLIAPMVRAGLVRKVGKTRGVTYRLS